MTIKLLFVCLSIHSTLSASSELRRSFEIDTNLESFVMDEKPFRIISGTFHYFQCFPEHWEKRMIQMRAAGLNTLQTYVQWSAHERDGPGMYDFKGRFDVEKFLDLAEKHGLYVIIRPGPYIDAERDFGGLPWWLLNREPSMKVRTVDPLYVNYVESWFDYAIPKIIRPRLYINGGNIIMVQIENEYGYFGCDLSYTTHLKKLLIKHLGNKAFYYTTDGCSIDNLRCGRVPTAYATVDFGAASNPSYCFKMQSFFEPKGPSMNSEFYPGWFDRWGYPHSVSSSKQVASTLDKMLRSNASVNIYPIFGGTNFGYEAGAKFEKNHYYPVTTSYDFDAPISEAGDVTEKYYAIKSVIEKYVNTSNLPKVPKNDSKEDYGKVFLQPAGSLFDFLNESPQQLTRQFPITFEEYGINQGFLTYTTTINEVFPSPANLNIPGVRDRAYIFINYKFSGIVLSRMFGGIFSAPLDILKGQKLTIIVESMGRVDFGPGLNDNFKGIVTNVTLNGKILQNWKIVGSDMNPSAVFEFANRKRTQKSSNSLGFWWGAFKIPKRKLPPKDTFLNLSNWRKGTAFLNGFNLGRYWTRMGPQHTLYVPNSILVPIHNIPNVLILFEQESAPEDLNLRFAEFTKIPILNGTTPISNNE